MEAHFAAVMFELIRLRRRLAEDRDISGKERETLALRIDQTFDTSNRFRFLEQKRRLEILYLTVKHLVGSEKFAQIKEDYPGLPFQELQKLIEEMKADNP